MPVSIDNSMQWRIAREMSDLEMRKGPRNQGCVGLFRFIIRRIERWFSFRSRSLHSQVFEQVRVVGGKGM